MERVRKGAGAQETQDKNCKAEEAPPENRLGERRLLTLAEVAIRCSASRSSVRRWAADPWTGFPRAVRLPGSQIRRYWLHEVDHWLAELPRHELRTTRSGAGS